FRLHAPHVGVSVVMPGHIGTEIVNNSRKIHGQAEGPQPDVLEAVRATMAQRGLPADSMDDDAILSLMEQMGDMFRDGAPMTAAQAAGVILDGVRTNQWRILVGDDAHRLDEAVRADPLSVYGEGGLNLLATVRPDL
ncbi:MAG: hypothetical protein ABL966_09060, partial [Acidimicrobiales bacterium]